MGKLNFLYCMDLPHRAKLVYLYLYDRKNKDNVTWPGLNTIARERYHIRLGLHMQLSFEGSYTGHFL